MFIIFENNLISVEVAKVVRYKYVVYVCSRKGRIVQIYQNLKEQKSKRKKE